jgi:hypothetical protein
VETSIIDVILYDEILQPLVDRAPEIGHEVGADALDAGARLGDPQRVVRLREDDDRELLAFVLQRPEDCEVFLDGLALVESSIDPQDGNVEPGQLGTGIEP